MAASSEPGGKLYGTWYIITEFKMSFFKYLKQCNLKKMDGWNISVPVQKILSNDIILDFLRFE